MSTALQYLTRLMLEQVCLEFSYWSDGNRNPSRTFTLSSRMILVATYTLISGYASCPSLYVWNGTGYSYVTDVSNPGWLGYISHINSNGQVVFGGGNPWDYVKLDSTLVATNNGNFDMTLAQQWDELYYLDSAYLLVVDHPAGTDAYTSMTNYLNNGSTGQIYTTTNGSLLITYQCHKRTRAKCSLPNFNRKTESTRQVLAEPKAKDGITYP